MTLKHDPLQINTNLEKGQTPPHSVIYRFYPLVLSLPEYISLIFDVQVLKRSVSWKQATYQECFEKLNSTLIGIQDLDHARQLKARLDGSSSLNRLARVPFLPRHDMTLGEVVHHAQLCIMRSFAAKSPFFGPLQGNNILTLGYKRPEDRVDSFKQIAPGQPGLVNLFPNTIVTTILTAPEYKLLYENIGDHALLQILSETSMFAPIPDKNKQATCYVQMCGQPLTELSEIATTHITPASEATKSNDKLETRHENTGKISRKRKRSTKANPFESDLPPQPQETLNQETFKQPKARPLSRNHSHASTVLTTTTTESVSRNKKRPRPASKPVEKKKLTEICFVRSRIFYSRSIRSRTGRVQVGLPYLHVFNRSKSFPELLKALRSTATLKSRLSLLRNNSANQKLDQTFPFRRARHFLKYIFPRQFGLHNVFTTPRDFYTTTQLFKDYSVREPEIRSLGSIKTPNRLRTLFRLVIAMANRHDRFDYRSLLDRCCPSTLPRRKLTMQEKAIIAEELSERPQDTFLDMLQTPAHHEPNRPESGQVGLVKTVAQVNNKKPRFTHYAVPSTGQVVHFVTMVIKRLVPRGFFGSLYNQRIILKNVSQFIRARRFENLNLHQVLQGFRMTDVEWVLPLGKTALWQRPTAAESNKRGELVAELIYWLFDSLVIPLVKTTFYVTESAAYRNRVLYFRQDDWHAISRPVLDKLKQTIFEPMTRSEALTVMSTRKLGYSHIRLLPKETGVRPIVNLRRRSTRQHHSASEKAATPWLTRKREKEQERLGQSINYILQSAFHILTYEKNRMSQNEGGLLGSSVFGPNEIYRRLKCFKSELEAGAALGTRRPNRHGGRPAKQQRLYFVKVDVRCAFDTIDQDKLAEIIQQVVCQKDGYLIQRFAKVMPAPCDVERSRCTKEYVKMARPDNDHDLFWNVASELASALHHIVFVDSVVYRHEERQRILDLLQQHVMGNLVKIGKDFYRQRIGIPQGSSLSTLLCNFFYADMESKKLGFVTKPGSLLMRYTDDFLFISSSKRKAKTFYQAMCKGHEEYGCFISKEKSLVNFDMMDPTRQEDGESVLVPRCRGKGFQWCGIVIDQATLGVKADLERYRQVDMADTLTVETGRKPGIIFVEKLLQSIKSRCHILFTDTALNGETRVYTNLFQSFVICALKFDAYLGTLSGFQINFTSSFLLKSIQRLTKFTSLQIRWRAISAKRVHSKASCMIEPYYIQWLGYFAFYKVLITKIYQRRGKKSLSPQIAFQVLHELNLLSSRRCFARKKLLGIATKAWYQSMDLLRL